MVRSGWRKVRRQAITAAGGRCQRCGGRRRLEGHHLDARRRFGVETKPARVVVLCRPCHRHVERLLREAGEERRWAAEELIDWSLR